MRTLRNVQTAVVRARVDEARMLIESAKEALEEAAANAAGLNGRTKDLAGRVSALEGERTHLSELIAEIDGPATRPGITEKVDGALTKRVADQKKEAESDTAP